MSLWNILSLMTFPSDLFATLFFYHCVILFYNRWRDMNMYLVQSTPSHPKLYVTFYFFNCAGLYLWPPNPIWRTTSCLLSVTLYSVYSHLLCMSGNLVFLRLYARFHGDGEQKRRNYCSEDNMWTPLAAEERGGEGAGGTGGGGGGG